MKEKIFKIYKHTSPSGKVYIGQTRYRNVIQRWRNGGKGYFRKNPKTGEYQQPYMVNAINKYPWNTWKHEILEICSTQEEADNLEKYYIKLYKSNNRKYGYNITEGGGGHGGQPVKQSTKEKLSEAIKELWQDPEYRAKQISRLKGKPMHENTRKALLAANIGRKCKDETKEKLKLVHANYILQFTKTGEFVTEHMSASEISDKTGISITSITNCCKGISKFCGDYIYLYKKEYEKNPNLLIERLERLKKRKANAKSILQYTKDNILIKEYPSVTDASQETGISNTSIGNCLTGRSKSAGGFKWIYKNDN